jgi:hypothetical protein
MLAMMRLLLDLVLQTVLPFLKEEMRIRSSDVAERPTKMRERANKSDAVFNQLRWIARQQLLPGA